MGFMDTLFGSDSSVDVISTLDKYQKNLVYPMLLSKMFGGGILPSELAASGSNLKKLLKSGALDDLVNSNPYKMFTGDRVADLTEDQLKILGNVNPLTDTVMAGPTTSGNFTKLLASRGFDTPAAASTYNPLAMMTAEPSLTTVSTAGESVGEAGPEVITANQDVVVSPSAKSSAYQRASQNGTLPNRGMPIEADYDDTQSYRSALNNFRNQQEKLAKMRGGSETVNPLVTEQNQVGANPDELLKRTRLPGYATGGVLKEGQSAVVGEQGQETVTPLKSATDQATLTALSGKPSTEINTGATEGLIQSSIVNPAWKNYN